MFALRSLRWLVFWRWSILPEAFEPDFVYTDDEYAELALRNKARVDQTFRWVAALCVLLLVIGAAMIALLWVVDYSSCVRSNTLRVRENALAGYLAPREPRLAAQVRVSTLRCSQVVPGT